MATMMIRFLLVLTLFVFGVIPAAQAKQVIEYRGATGRTVVKFTVVRRDSGRRFIVSQSLKHVPATCDDGTDLEGGAVTGGLDTRLRDDRPFQIDVVALGFGDASFHTEGTLGWRKGEGTLTFTVTHEGSPCTSGELSWMVERYRIGTAREVATAPSGGL